LTQMQLRRKQVSCWQSVPARMSDNGLADVVEVVAAFHVTMLALRYTQSPVPAIVYNCQGSSATRGCQVMIFQFRSSSPVASMYFI
jgi:hypothetical protein